MIIHPSAWFTPIPSIFIYMPVSRPRHLTKIRVYNSRRTDMVFVFKARQVGENDIRQIRGNISMFIAYTRRCWKQDYYAVLNIFPTGYTLGFERRNSQR